MTQTTQLQRLSLQFSENQISEAEYRLQRKALVLELVGGIKDGFEAPVTSEQAVLPAIHSKETSQAYSSEPSNKENSKMVPVAGLIFTVVLIGVLLVFFVSHDNEPGDARVDVRSDDINLLLSELIQDGNLSVGDTQKIITLWQTLLPVDKSAFIATLTSRAFETEEYSSGVTSEAFTKLNYELQYQDNPLVSLMQWILQNGELPETDLNELSSIWHRSNALRQQEFVKYTDVSLSVANSDIDMEQDILILESVRSELNIVQSDGSRDVVLDSDIEPEIIDLLQNQAVAVSLNNDLDDELLGNSTEQNTGELANKIEPVLEEVTSPPDAQQEETKPGEIISQQSSSSEAVENEPVSALVTESVDVLDTAQSSATSDTKSTQAAAQTPDETSLIETEDSEEPMEVADLDSNQDVPQEVTMAVGKEETIDEDGSNEHSSFRDQQVIEVTRQYSEIPDEGAIITYLQTAFAAPQWDTPSQLTEIKEQYSSWGKQLYESLLASGINEEEAKRTAVSRSLEILARLPNIEEIYDRLSKLSSDLRENNDPELQMYKDNVNKLHRTVSEARKTNRDN